MEPEEQNQQSQPELQQQPVQPPQEQWQTPAQPQVAPKTGFAMPKWAIIAIITVVTIVVVGTGGYLIYKTMVTKSGSDTAQATSNSTIGTSSNTDYANKELNVEPYLEEIMKGRWYRNPTDWHEFKDTPREGEVTVYRDMADVHFSTGQYKFTSTGVLTITGGLPRNDQISYYDGEMLLMSDVNNGVLSWWGREGGEGSDWFNLALSNASVFDKATSVNDLYKAGVLDPSKNLLFK